jgi:recombinational DNA repair protein RecT
LREKIALKNVRSFVRSAKKSTSRQINLPSRAERQAEMFDERTKRFAELKCLTIAQKNVLTNRAEMFEH